MPDYQMPDPGKHSAPSFSGEPEYLVRFFNEVEFHAAKATLDDATKVTYACRYIKNRDDYQTWTRIAKMHADNWTTFKATVYEQYPGSQGNESANICELEQLIETYRNTITTTGANILSERQAVAYFLSAFPDNIPSKVDHILLTWEPKKPHREVYTLDNVYRAVLHTYGDGLTASKGKQRAITPSAPVKSEANFSSMIRTAVQDAMAPFASLLSQQGITATPLIPATNQHVTALPSSSPRPCAFCGSQDHYLRFCNEARRYESEGHVKRNEYGKYTTPTGIEINRSMRGAYFKNQIDNWHHDNPGHRTTAAATPTANLVSVATLHKDNWSLDDKIRELTNMYKLSSSDVQDLRRILSNGTSTTTATPVPTALAPAQDTFTAQTTHRYQSSIEDPKIVDSVIQRALNGTIQLTMKELLAISPDVRKGIHERLQPKRVPNEPATSAQVCTICRRPPPAPAPPDSDSDDDYEAAITALYQLDEDEPPPQPALSLLNATNINVASSPTQFQQHRAYGSRRTRLHALPPCLRKRRSPEHVQSAHNHDRRKR
ncbi:Retrotransposon gag domain-containing protein [Pleurotus pulmonarius]